MAENRYITFGRAAELSGRKENTLRNWMYAGKLTLANGLVRIAGKPMIDWPLYERCFVERAPEAPV